MLIKRTRIPYLQIVLTGFLPSFLKVVFYKLKGYKIGENVSIGLGSVVIGKNVSVMANTRIGFFTVIRGRHITIERFVSIGSFDFIDCDCIRIGEDSRINEQVIIGGLKTPTSSIDIGERTIIMEYSFINPTLPIKIGDDTGIGGHCLIFTHGTWLNALNGFPFKYAPITIGNNVWLAWRVFILPGITIGSNVVIGADSLVSKNLPANSLAAGSPVKLLKENYPSPLNEPRRKKLIEEILEEFCEFLKYSGFSVSLYRVQDGIKIQVKNKKKLSEIIFSNETQNASNIADNVLLIDRNDYTNNHNDSSMILNLKNSTRIGSSRVGEEIAKYFSRYGIRFKRLD